MKLKILHTIYSGLGGHGNVLFPLLESEFGHMYDHHIVFYGVEETIDDYKARCHRLGISFETIQKKPKRYLRAFKAFKKILLTVQPHYVFVHNSELLIPAIRNKAHHTKVIYVEHQNNENKGRMLHYLSSMAGKKADAIVCLTTSFKEQLNEMYDIRVPISVIPNGIDIKKFNSNVEKIGVNAIGMAARMVTGKDFMSLLEAFALINKDYPHLQLMLAGDGPLYDEIQKSINDLGLSNNVVMMGLLNEDEMIRFYSEIDMYVQSTFGETLSTSILQAMSMKLPVVASDIENNKILIEHRNTGLLFKTGDAMSLRDAIKCLMENEGVSRENLGTNARYFIENYYSKEAMSKKYASLIQSFDTKE